MGIKFTLFKNAVARMSNRPVQVPILVASDDTGCPIISFNVIEELALRNDMYKDNIPPSHIVNRLYSALEVGHKTARAVLSVLIMRVKANLT